MMTFPDSVLFDFGGTLFDDHFDVRAGQRRMLELAGFSEVTIQEYATVAAELDRELILRRDSVMLEYPAQAFHRLLRDRLRLSYEQDDARLELEFWKAAETCTPRPQLLSTLLALRGRGVRLAIISNMTFSPAVIEYELAKANLLGAFDLVVTSADYCVRRPHPLIFRVLSAGVRN
jgi:FMN phosphatase YigB (HAD superfamily)